MIYAIEGLRRAPLSLRTREIVAAARAHGAPAADGPRVLERSLAPVDAAARLARERVTAARCCWPSRRPRQRRRVALWRGGELLGERAADPGRATAEALLPALDALLADAGVALAAVEGFAVSIGPGSFTGSAHRGRDREGARVRHGAARGRGVDARGARALTRPGPAPGRGRARRAARRGLRGRLRSAAAPADWLAGGRVRDRRRSRRGCRRAAAWWERARRCARRRCAAPTSALVPPPYPETTARHVARLALRAWQRGEAVPAREPRAALPAPRGGRGEAHRAALRTVFDTLRTLA